MQEHKISEGDALDDMHIFVHLVFTLANLHFIAPYDNRNGCVWVNGSQFFQVVKGYLDC